MFNHNCFTYNYKYKGQNPYSGSSASETVKIDIPIEFSFTYWGDDGTISCIKNGKTDKLMLDKCKFAYDFVNEYETWNSNNIVNIELNLNKYYINFNVIKENNKGTNVIKLILLKIKYIIHLFMLLLVEIMHIKF